MGSTVEVTASDGHKLAAYLATPAGKPRGGLVVIQEVFGVTPYIQSVCDAYAADGYLSIAPWLYDRQQRGAVFAPENHDQARKLREKFVWDDVVKDVAAAAARVGEAGKVGIVGFCVGGSVAWLAASRLNLAAASSYYGRDIAGWIGKENPRCPIVVHYGRTDSSIPLADVDRVIAAYPQLPIHIYDDAGHAFDNFTRPSYVPDAAKAGRERTLSLFRQHIG